MEAFWDALEALTGVSLVAVMVAWVVLFLEACMPAVTP